MSTLPKSDCGKSGLETAKADLTNAFINAAIRAERFGRTGTLSHVPPVAVIAEAPVPAQG
jgi:hypothetical protein